MRYLLIDGNSIGHAANNGTTLTVGQQEVQAIYGFARSLRMLMGVYSAGGTPIVLWDGASWRKLRFPDYKENREKADTANERKVLAAKLSFKKQSRAIETMIRLLGIDQLRAGNMEADDLAGILTDRYTARGDKVLLVSGDKDWIQLVGPNCSWFDPINDRKVTTKNFKEKTGVDTAAQFVEMKALMGDSGDNVPGVGGIGDKGAVEFLTTYGSFANFSNMVLDGSLDPKTLHKKYRDLAESEDKRMLFSRNLELVDLRTKLRPTPLNLTATKGVANKEAFRTFCQKLLFRSILKDFDAWLEAFPTFQVPWNEEKAA